MTSPILSGFTPIFSVLENTVNATPQVLDNSVTFTDANGDYDGGFLTLDNPAGMLAEDILSIQNQGTGVGEIGLSGTDVSYEGTLIGTLTGGDGTMLQVDFNDNATPAAIEALIQNLTFAYISDAPVVDRRLALNITDAAGNDLGPGGMVYEKIFPEGNSAFQALSLNSYVDLDGDGDLDVIRGFSFGSLRVAINEDGVFGTQTVFQDNDFTVGSRARPAFGILDGGNDPDGVIGAADGTLLYLQNTGGVFTELTGAANPFDGVDVGDNSSPTLVDLDGDGDLDVVVGANDGTLSVFDNDDGVFGFTQLTGAANPFFGMDFGGAVVPAFSDLDFDGDLDLAVGLEAGGVRFWLKNDDGTGYTQLPDTSEEDFGRTFRDTTIAFADFDGDGIDEAIVTDGVNVTGYGGVFQGTQIDGALVSVTITPEVDTPVVANVPTEFTVDEDTTLGVDLSGISLTGFDGDNVMVLLVGDVEFRDAVLRGSGSLQIDDLALRESTDNLQLNGTAIAIEKFLSDPSAIVYRAPQDENGEALEQVDIFISDDGFTFDDWLYEGTIDINVTPVAEAPTLAEVDPELILLEDTVNVTPQFLDTSVIFASELGSFEGGTLIVDGLLAEDIVSVHNQGIGGGEIGLSGDQITYQGVTIGTKSGGIGTPLVITFNAVANTLSIQALIQNLTYSNLSNAPTLSRDLGLNITDANGQELGAQFDIFEQLIGADNPYDGLNFGVGSRPQFVDLDGDGDLDVAVALTDGTVTVFDNNDADGGFTELNGGDNPFADFDLPYFDRRPYLTFADFDGDGDTDLLGQTTESQGGIVLWDNTDDDDGFADITPPDGLFAEDIFIEVGAVFAPVDLDGDGDLDLVVLDTGSLASAPRVFDNNDDDAGFTEIAETANPFAHFAILRSRSAEFVDLDGDGDLDLVVAKTDGTVLAIERTDAGYERLIGTENPFDGLDLGSRGSGLIQFLDVDDDGDLDLVSTDSDGVISTYANNGRLPNSTITVTVVAENDAPIFLDVPEDVTALEDTASSLDLSAFTLKDDDSDATFTLVIAASSGTMTANGRGDVTVTGGGTDTLTFTGRAGDIDAMLNSPATIQYTGAADLFGSDVASLTLTANDGENDIAQGVVNIVIADLNDAPELAGLVKAVTFGEDVVNATPQLLDMDVSVSDLEDNFDGGILSVSGLLPEDVLSVQDQGVDAGQVGLSGGEVTYGGTTIGTLNGGNGVPLIITFNSAASAVGIEAVIENLTYANISDSPTEQRNLILNLTDGAGLDIGPGRPSFTPSSVLNNPLEGLGLDETPTFADLDGNGFLDLVVGTEGGTLTSYSQFSQGFYFERVGDSDPFLNIDVGFDATPTFIDIDGDDDLDLVVGNISGFLDTFENVAGTYTELRGDANPFGAVDLDFRANSVAVDWDDDGDVDLVVGNNNGALNVIDNDDEGGFTQLIGAANPFDGFDFGLRSYIAPSFADLDNDGDLDLLMGSSNGTLRLFDNEASVFTEVTGFLNPFDGVDVGFGSRPTFVDIDGDADLDLVVGSTFDTLQVFLNSSPVGDVMTLTVLADNDTTTLTGLPSNVTTTEDTRTALDLSGVTLVDDDSTAEFTLVLSATRGTLSAVSDDVTITGSGSEILELTGTASQIDAFLNDADTLQYQGPLNSDGPARITIRTNDGFDEINHGFISVDISPRNDAPLLTNFASVRTFKESAVNDAPQFLDTNVQFSDPESNFDGGTLRITGLLAEDVVALNHQGTDVGQIGVSGDSVLANGVAIGTITGGVGTDLVIVFNDQATSAAIDLLIQNLTYANASDTPTTARNLLLNVTDAEGADLIADNQSFAQLSGGDDPFKGAKVGNFSAPAFVDLDGDGDLDAVVGDVSGKLTVFDKDNTGRDFTRLSDAQNSLADIDVGVASKPSFVDLDGDGDLDLVIGALDGTLRAFDNTGAGGGFAELTGADNPFAAVTVGYFSAPSFTDLDMDGDLDLVVGAIDGSLNVFDNNDDDAGYTQLLGALNPFANFTGLNAQSTAPTFVDFDLDGDMDLVLGNEFGQTHVFSRDAADNAAGYVFTPLSNENAGVWFPLATGNTTPVFVDLDGDFDLDMVQGSLDGALIAYENTTPLSPLIKVIVQAENELLEGTSGRNTLVGSATADTILGFGGNDTIRGGAGGDALRGGSGQDTLDYKKSALGVSVNLATGEASGGDATGDTFTRFERISGSSFDDVLIGDAGRNTLLGNGGADQLFGASGNDILRGGTGADILDGGAGTDVVNYKQSSEGVSVNLATSAVSGGTAEGDTITGFEDIMGSDHDDILVGDAGKNTITGGKGGDVLEGGDGGDILDYTQSSQGVTIDLDANTASGGDAAGDTISGFEHILGSAHDDVLIGDSARNIITGGAGADQLDGGANADTLDYKNSSSGVAINLVTGVVSGGDADGDTISGFEHILGSAYDDVLRGDSQRNILTGGAGSDEMNGGSNQDIARYTGLSSDFNVVYIDNGTWQVEDRKNGDVDTLKNIEVIKFKDMDVALPDVVALGDEDTPILGQLSAMSVSGPAEDLTYTLAAAAQNGVVTVEDDGSFTYTGAQNFAGLDSFSYMVENADGQMEEETVTVSVNAVADAPTISVETMSGDAINEIRFRVSVNQNDADGSEFFAPIITSGVPNGANLTAGAVMAGAELGTITQEFVLTLAGDESSVFDLTFSAQSIEAVNANTAQNEVTVPIVFEHTNTTASTGFSAQDQNIWNTGEEFVFVSEQFIGLDTGVFGDSRTSGPFSVGLEGDISLGLQSTLTLAGGQIDAEAIYDVSVDTTFNATTDQLILDTNAALSSAAFTTQGPSGTYTLDFLYDIYLEAFATVDVDLPSVGPIDPGSITEEIRYDMNVPNGSATLIDLNSSDDLAVTLEFPAPLSAFSVDFAWPDITTTGSDTQTGTGASNNFIEMALDLDELLFQLLGQPFNPLDPPKIEGPEEDPVFFADFDLLDIDLVGGVNFLQEFELSLGELTGFLVFEDTSVQSFTFGDSIEIADASLIDAGGDGDGEVEFEFVISPTATLNNDTDLGYNVGVDVNVFSAEVGYELQFDVPEVGAVIATDSLEFDPLVSFEPSLPIASEDVYDLTFNLGFETETLTFAV